MINQQRMLRACFYLFFIYFFGGTIFKVPSLFVRRGFGPQIPAVATIYFTLWATEAVFLFAATFTFDIPSQGPISFAAAFGPQNGE